MIPPLISLERIDKSSQEVFLVDKGDFIGHQMNSKQNYFMVPGDVHVLPGCAFFVFALKCGNIVATH